MYTVNEVVEEVASKFDLFFTEWSREQLLKRWLDEIWGEERQVDEIHFSFPDKEALVLNLLALAGNRLWALSLNLKSANGYNASSFITDDISRLQLEMAAGTVTLKIAGEPVFSGEGDEAKYLISLHQRLSS